MSDNFIPLNQSTPVQNKWHQNKNQKHIFHNNRQQKGQRRYYKGGNNSRSSYGSNSSNNSYSQDRNNIDAFLHPSMLQDPWATLRQENVPNSSNT